MVIVGTERVRKDHYHVDKLARANGNFGILYSDAIRDLNLGIADIARGESKQEAFDRLVTQIDLLNGGGR